MNLNSNEQLKKLLIKENELKNAKMDIEKYKKEIKENKNKSNCAEILNAAIYTLDILFFILGSSTIPLLSLSIFIFMNHVILKCINISIYGTKITRGKERYGLERMLNSLEDLIPILEKQISEIKKNNNFVISKENNYFNKSNVISHQNEITTSKQKIKILSIKQKKNEK